MKGEIIEISKQTDEFNNKRWIVTTSYEKPPTLRMGECKILQEEKEQWKKDN